MEVANIEKLDRWRLEVRAKEEAEKHAKATDSLPASLAVFNNYFSMGIDAHIALQFHNARNANSDKFTSRTRNLLFYGLEGGKDLVVHKWRHLMDSVRWDTCTCRWWWFNPGPDTRDNNNTSAANRLIGEVVQSRRRPLLGPSPG